jgi:hypothetical protein
MKKTMFHSLLIIAAVVFVLALALGACSEPGYGSGGGSGRPGNGGPTGSLTINFGASTDARAAWKPGDGLPEAAINELTHNVTLSQGATVIKRSYSKGTVSATIDVAAGVWKVKVEAVCYDVTVATAGFDVTIVAGTRNSVPVKMQQTNTDFYTVSTANELGAAYIDISNNPRGLGNCLILLTRDIKMSAQTAGQPNFGDYTGKVSVCGNKTISLEGPGVLFYVAGDVVLYDVKLKGVDDNTSPLVEVNSGTLTMKGGASVYDNTNTSTNGGGVSVTGGTFAMQDSASVYGNTAASGGGVYVDGGTFTMLGSTSVHDNTGDEVGGGVYIENGGTFTMRDNASVYGNTGEYGSGMYVKDGTFTMQGSASVYGNTAPNSGGVYVQNTNFTMEGNASVRDNKAVTNRGGGVYVNGVFATFTMRDSASVYGNNADLGGGGVCVALGGRFLMQNNASVHNNTVHNNASVFGYGGGGVYLDSTSTRIVFIMEGSASVYGNTASDNGGGVWVNNNSTFNMYDSASIYGNTAANNGGGVWVSGTGIFQIQSGAIYGSNESNVKLRNTANGSPPAGSALFVTSGGTAQYGTFDSNGNFTPNPTNPDLTTRDATVKIVNGVLIP